MNFSEALDAMRAGKKVRRLFQNQPGTMRIDYYSDGHPIFMFSNDARSEEWTAVLGAADVLATDWEIVE